MNKKEVFKLAKGFRAKTKNCIPIAPKRVEKALQLIFFLDRRNKKRINAGIRQHRPQIEGEGTKACSTEQSDLHLPEEIIEEILSRLPVKSLLRFRCVSKLWRCLIGSGGFIKTQFQNSTKNTSLTHYGAISSSYGTLVRLGSLHSLLNEPSLLRKIRPIAGYMTGHYNGMRGRVVDCCNGLVCIREKGCFFLWNPATRISFNLPDIEGFEYLPDSKCGFGWDAASGAYKVFTVVMSNDRHRKILGQIYSSKTNSWTTIDVEHISACAGFGLFVRGKIHWLTRHEIDSFDLNSEVFGVTEFPCSDPELDNPWFGEIKECLGLVCDKKDRSQLGVWVMKESWVKLLTVPLASPQRYRELALFEISGEGVILVMNGSALLVYNCDDSSPIEFNTIWKASKVGGRDGMCCYVESLVSPVPQMNL